MTSKPSKIVGALLEGKAYPYNTAFMPLNNSNDFDSFLNNETCLYRWDGYRMQFLVTLPDFDADGEEGSICVGRKSFVSKPNKKLPYKEYKDVCDEFRQSKAEWNATDAPDQVHMYLNASSENYDAISVVTIEDLQKELEATGWVNTPEPKPYDPFDL